MSHISFLALGLGLGGVIAALSIGIVVTYRASRVVNFAHAAMGTYVGFVFYELRATGDLVFPILGLPDRWHVVDRPTVATALAVSLVVAAIVGAALYQLVFRHLRAAAALIRLVASLGLLLYFIAMIGPRFGSTSAASRVIDGPLPDRLVSIGGVQAPVDRYILAALAVVAAALLSALYRWTRFGLATRAIADNERAGVLLGLSPHSIGALNWALGSMLAGAAMILAAPIIRLDASTASLLVISAIAAALPGRLESVWVAVVFGLAIGMLQSELLNLQAEWTWLPDVGLQQGVPFLVIIATLMTVGGIVERGGIASSDLPRVDMGGVRLPAAVMVVLGIAGTLLLDSAWRLGIIVSATAVVIALSIVVVTGFVGQISFATYAIAGVAAFATVRIGSGLGVGFPWAPLLGVVVAVAAGQVAALPALRVQGLNLAIATLAAAVAVEELVFKWSWFTGGLLGSQIEAPRVFGVDVGINAIGDAFPTKRFGVMVVAVAGALALLVANLRDGITGRRWLALRSNERAASGVGVDVARAKLLAFGVASALAGIAGVLIAYQRQLVSVGSFMVFASLVAVAITALGGISSPTGAILAGLMASNGLLTVALEHWQDDASQHQVALSGLLLVAAAIWLPRGIVGATGRVRGRAIRG